MFKTFRTRLLLLSLALVLIPAIVIVGVFVARVSDEFIQDSYSDQNVALDSVQTRIEASLVHRTEDLELFQQLYGLSGLSIYQQRELLQTLLVKQDAYDTITLATANGQERAKVSRFEVVTTNDLGNISNDAIFQEAVTTGQPVYSRVFIDPQTAEPLLRIGVPFTNLRTQSVDSVILADFRFRIIWNLLRDFGTTNKEQVTVYLVDEAGEVVAHPNPTIVLRGTYFTPTTQQGNVTGLDGNQVSLTSRPLTIGNRQFTLVSEQDFGEVTAPLFQSLAASLVITLIAVAVAVILAYVVVSQVVRPVEQLSAAAQAVQAGNLNTQIQVQGSQEIVLLGRSFNEMVYRLRDFINTLEDRVAERTRDLTLASDVSRQASTELNPDALLEQVVTLTTDAFRLADVAVYLYDGEYGLNLAESKTTSPTEVGVVHAPFIAIHQTNTTARAARERQVVLDRDQHREVLAVPMRFREQLIGVLEVQAAQGNQLSNNDIGIMTTLAEQIGIAVRNAQLFEEVQQALSRAEQADKVKSAFLASMSHELRTPLNSVINFTKFVANGVMGPVNEEQRATLEEVIDSGKHLLNLINDVLDMSKIEAGSLRLFVEDEVDLNSILNSVASASRTLLQDKPVTLRTDFKTTLPSIRGDRQRLLQIFYNLVSNACKFTEVGTVTLSATTTNDEVTIAVADTGPGISSEDLASVFEPFKQTVTGLRQGGGTGLGMPITKSLVEAHQGSLRIESQVDKGTTVYVSLPIQSPALIPFVPVRTLAPTL